MLAWGPGWNAPEAPAGNKRTIARTAGFREAPRRRRLGRESFLLSVGVCAASSKWGNGAASALWFPAGRTGPQSMGMPGISQGPLLTPQAFPTVTNGHLIYSRPHAAAAISDASVSDSTPQQRSSSAFAVFSPITPSARSCSLAVSSASCSGRSMLPMA